MWIKLVKQTGKDKTVRLINMQHVRGIMFIVGHKVSLVIELANGDMEIIEGANAQKLWSQIANQIPAETVIASMEQAE